MLVELDRRGYEVTYVKGERGFEVDYLAERAGDAPLLIQVCLESTGDETWDRELRALDDAAEEDPEATCLLITLDDVPPDRPMSERVTWVAASRWLLGDATPD